MVRNPGLDLDSIFVRIRARAHQISEGRQTPWHVSALGADVLFVPGMLRPTWRHLRRRARGSQAGRGRCGRSVRTRPMRRRSNSTRYPGYVEFVSAYPRHAYAPRIWATIRARRESLAWLRAVQLNTPPAYWTYLRRYPDGVYSAMRNFACAGCQRRGLRRRPSHRSSSSTCRPRFPKSRRHSSQRRPEVRVHQLC